MADKTAEKEVYTAINAVTAALAKEGIQKSRTAEAGQSRYRFRGIDDVYNALAPILSANKLCILPRVIDRVVTERATRSGGVATFVVLAVEYDLVSAVDGSQHTIRTMGEAMDTSDKATNKAMSAAYKYACMQAFAIPTEGQSEDSEKDHIEPAPKAAKVAPVPLLEKQLAASVESLDIAVSLSTKLQSAADLGELVEAWADVTESKKSGHISDAQLRELAEVKDAKKRGLVK